ncbi:MAG TPA: ABC transporter ATP-binding protein [Gaiellaceae bacterium]|nr:ABC transporter ATP-binding protein [Gaiellaceae bacterium]
MHELAIEARDLRKRFGDVQAVAGISFAVARGEVFGLVGPNGAGKTTTLEMIEGLRRPDHGEAFVLGHPVWPRPQAVQRRIGVQLQTTALFDYLSSSELLALFGELYGALPRGRISAVLEQVGLEEKAHARVNQLSGGQQQRLAIALALVHQPEIVFLDEPTTGLDPAARRQLWEVVRAIEAEGRTVVLTTHYMEEAEQLCDRVGIVEGGKLVALDTPLRLIRTIRQRSRVLFRDRGGLDGALGGLPGVVEVRQTEDGPELTTEDARATVAALLDRAAERGVELEELAVKTPTLEDVYLELTGKEFAA